MAKIKINPSKGTLIQSKNVHFSISDIVDYENSYIYVENMTNSSKCLMNNTLDNKLYLNSSSVDFTVDLNIPEEFDGDLISLFINIKKDDKVNEIIPVIYYLEQEEANFSGNISLSSTFLSFFDMATIEISSNPLSKYIFSINGKKVYIYTRENGIGSLTFKMSDIIDSDEKIIKRYPVYFYSEEDNYVKKNFSGLYVTVLPSSIKTYADLDPRCDADSSEFVLPGTWVKPASCDVNPPPIDPDTNGCKTDSDCPNGFVCNNGQCVPVDNPVVPDPIDGETNPVDNDYEYTNVCRINSYSFALLNNGKAIGSFSSVDKSIEKSDERYNVNGYGYDFFKTTVVNKIIANSDVIIASNINNIVESSVSSYNIEIHVPEDLYNQISHIDFESREIKVLLMDKIVNYSSFKIFDVRVDEYTGDYIVVLENSNSKLIISDWVFCVPSVFYDVNSTNTDSTVDQSQNLINIVDSNGNYLKILNIEVSSNPYYNSNVDVGTGTEYSVVFFVAECIVDNKSQLFIKKYVFNENEEAVTNLMNDWGQLTFYGNNRNPKLSMDKNGVLHIVWESDRLGSTQIYYGIYNDNDFYKTAFSLSSSIDKNSKTDEDSLFEYAEINDDLGLNEIPQYSSSDIFLTNEWNVFVGDSSFYLNTSDNSNGKYFKDIEVYTNPSLCGALAVASMQILLDEDLNDPSNPSIDSYGDLYSQINYQISFKFSSEVMQENNPLSHLFLNQFISVEDLDYIYSEWIKEYTPVIDENIENKKIYTKDGEKYVIGRIDGIYDKIIPFLGSYSFLGNNPSSVDYRLKLMKDDSTLKDFSFGLMLEKSYFKATNISTLESTDYIIYTGNAKIVVLIKTEDEVDYSNYFLIKEISDSFNIFEVNSFDLVVNYIRINEDRYSCILTLLKNSKEIFSQSFLSSIDFSYNYFDIAFGVPDGYGYLSDKLMPYKLSLFDNVDIKMNFSDIDITSPSLVLKEDLICSPFTYGFRYYRNRNEIIRTNLSEEIIDGWEQNLKEDETYRDYSIPSNVNQIKVGFKTRSDGDRLIVTDITDGSVVLYDTGSKYLSDYGGTKFDYFVIDVNPESLIRVKVIRESLVFSISVSYIYSDSFVSQISQSPVTFNGVNKSPKIKIGFCDDIHIVWQGNQDKYWNIYTSNSYDLRNYLRYNTKITDTNSNSLMPDISFDRKGNRMIVWHDDRDQKFNIYSARSIGGYGCSIDECRNNNAYDYKDRISECYVEFEFEAESSGYYNFILSFYLDHSLDVLHKQVDTVFNLSDFYVNGHSLSSVGSYNGEDFLGFEMNSGDRILITYVPTDDDDLYDKILYVNLSGIVNEI